MCSNQLYKILLVVFKFFFVVVVFTIIYKKCLCNQIGIINSFINSRYSVTNVTLDFPEIRNEYCVLIKDARGNSFFSDTEAFFSPRLLRLL